MKKKLLTAFQYFLFLGLGIFLVWWSIHKMDEKNWNECKQAMASARYILFVPVFLIISASHVSRAMRWKILMKPMGYNPKFYNTFFAVMVGYLANLAIPRLGEVLKCTILGKYEKVPAEKLVGTILVERVVDVLCLFLVFIIAFISQASVIGEYAKGSLNQYFISKSSGYFSLKLILLFVILLSLFFILRFVFKQYHNYIFIQRLKALVTGVKTGISSIKNLQNKTAFILHSIFIWCCYVGGTYLGFYATIQTNQLPFASVFPILAFASIGMIITPGGIGTYPRFIMEVMMLYNIEEGIAYANGTLQWLAQFLIILFVGFLSLSLLPHFNKKAANTDT